jgi:hypothetical protein
MAESLYAAGYRNPRHDVDVKVLALVAVVLVSGGSARPALRPLDLDPLTLAGSNFRANERVTLLVAAPPVVKSTRVRANARGRFRVVFRVKVGRCDAAVVQAIGARGSRATFQHDTLDCAEP